MAHIHKLIDFVVTVFIVFENKILLIHHKELNKWLPIGGHIELNENTDEALLREIKEECRLKVAIITRDKKPKLRDTSRETNFLHTPYYLDIHKINDNHRHISLTYFAKAKSNKIKLKDDEHNNIRWFSEKDLNDPKFKVQKTIKYYAKEALKITK